MGTRKCSFRSVVLFQSEVHGGPTETRCSRLALFASDAFYLRAFTSLLEPTSCNLEADLMAKFALVL